MVRVVVLALVFLASTSSLAAAPEEFGLELMPSARKVGEHRYQSDRNYEATLKFFREKFRGWKSVRWLREVSIPGVKYVHIENTNETSGWDGVNIYQLPDGTVRVYVLERAKAPAAQAPAGPSAPSSAPSSPASSKTTP